MEWKTFLRDQIEQAYQSTHELITLVEDQDLHYCPGDHNWMRLDQLLWHITIACGRCCVCMIEDDWSDNPWHQLPSVTSVQEALKRLEEDKVLALDALETLSENELEEKLYAPPWEATPQKLGIRFYQMIKHLQFHRFQLLFYFRLSGKPLE